MNAERQQFSLALGLSAGANLLLFFFIAWSMAVSAGLAGNRSSTKAAFLPAASAPSLPEVISIVLAPDTESAPPPPERKMINSPADLPDAPAPSDAATRFISSNNLKAASEAAASPDGIAGLPTQLGVDQPFLDLRDSDFRDGDDQPNARRPPVAAPPPPSPNDSPPLSPSPPPEPDPPADSARSTLAEFPSAPLRTEPNATPPESAPPAFRDSEAPALIPQPEPALAKFQPTPPPRPEPPPLTRIPDRVPASTYAAGTRKTKQLGTISNKGTASVDALATAEGRFGKVIRTAIEKGWRRRMLSLSSLANPGLVEVEFEVDPKGRISNVKLANPGEANPVMQDCALSAVIEAKLPPPPSALFEELQDNLTGGRMRCSFSFLIY